MFRKNYREAMDGIHADPSSLEKIQDRVSPDKKQKIRPVIIWRAATVCVLAVAVISGVLVSPYFHPNKKANEQKTVVSAENYDEIYGKIKTLRKNTQYLYATDISAGNAVNGSIALKSATADTLAETAAPEHSETTHQVEGVDEADIVKTDGKYIYILHENTLSIFSAISGKMQTVGTLTVCDSKNCRATELYLSAKKIAVLIDEYDEQTYQSYSKITVIDISRPEQPKTVGTCRQSGYLNTSRLIGNTLYVISNYSVNFDAVRKKKPETFVPCLTVNDKEKSVGSETVHFCDDALDEATYVTVCSYSLDTAEPIATQSLLGGCQTVYCSTENLIVTSYCRNQTDSRFYTRFSDTFAARFSLNKGKIKYETDAVISGTLLNQFSIDEYENHFRFVVTEYKNDTTVNSLYVLNGNLETVGSIKDLAPNEQVYSVRFMGKNAYFVTFRQTDPLFSADLSDPKNPKLLGALKISGFSDYLFPYRDGKLLGIGMEADEQTGRTQCMKLSLFDISDPSNVTETDKTVLTDYRYSAALYDHRNCLVEPQKNLFGFSAYGVTDQPYLLYTFGENGFQKIAAISNPVNCNFVRGLLIENTLYVITDQGIQSFDLTENVQPIDSVRF